MSRYEIEHIDDVPQLGEVNPITPLRKHFGITAFGVNAWQGAAEGDRLIPEHSEDEGGDEELYIVLRGRAAFELDGERKDAPARTLVYVQPGVKRTAFAEEPGTTIVAIGGTPGKAFEASDWELWHAVRPLYDSGAYDEAAAGLRELVAANPENGVLLYNLACCESLGGRKEDALEHLGRALALSDRFKDFAAKDTDLEAIRNEPGFDELLRTSR